MSFRQSLIFLTLVEMFFVSPWKSAIAPGCVAKTEVHLLPGRALALHEVGSIRTYDLNYDHNHCSLSNSSGERQRWQLSYSSNESRR